MIHIINNYYLDADPRQFMLKKKVTGKLNKETGKISKDSFVITGYYGSLSFLLGGLVQIEAQRAVSDCQTMAGVIDNVEHFGDCLTKSLTKNLKEAVQQFEAPTPCIACGTTETFKPSHDGSRNCESGSIASGGNRAHCSCDACF